MKNYDIWQDHCKLICTYYQINILKTETMNKKKTDVCAKYMQTISLDVERRLIKVRVRGRLDS